MSSALRAIKLSTLTLTSALGVFRAVRDSDWRARQLLILCYHGVSIDDEHEWAPGLYLTARAFENRLQLLARHGCSVLPLEEGLTRLYEGRLPPRSVVITFDDGSHDFRACAMPVLQSYGFPATVFLTTYYSDANLPVFPLVLSYILWKGRGADAVVTLSSGETRAVKTRTAAERRLTLETLVSHVQTSGQSAVQKDRLAQDVAAALGVDYATLRARRMLHLMNADEVREVAAAGFDVQLHTHRHRSPPHRDAYHQEISQNRERIVSMLGTSPRHFCYPSGAWAPEYANWLREGGVVSAVTCEPGMATAQTDPLRLPRLLDHSELTPIEFEAWIAGIGARLPRRQIGRHVVDEQGRPALGRAGEAPPVPASAGA
jgi:peptidoglycan/xylan/chitin deacetylase (PgdA/CDA1 family)